ncbi:MAG: hypothetical protein Aurels2KO_21670 [Aureliella sp.]
MDDFDDGELLQLIADRKSDEESARAAFSEFYFRHLPWLIKESEKRAFRIPGRDAEGFAADVIASVYESKATKFPANKFASRIDAARAVRAWLGRIAENRLVDIYRVRGDTTENSNIEQLYDPVTADNESASAFETDTATSLRPQVSCASRMLAELSDRDKVIVLTYLKFQQKGKRLPSKELQKLANRFSLAADSVRRVYYRFRESVQQEIEKLQQ